MKKNTLAFGIALSVALMALSAKSQEFNIEDYNKSLIRNGVAWNASQEIYLPSFYTGFAPRIEDPNHIHLRLGRGNQIRLTTQLDEYSILTYVYGLKKREALFDQTVQQGLIQLKQQDQLSLFKSVINSSHYNINALIQNLETNKITKEEFYKQSLQIIEELNKGRVFHIKINLTTYIERWQNTVNAFLSTTNGTIEEAVTKNPQKTITLLNDLVWGRINLTYVTAEIKNKLIETIKNKANPSEFSKNALELLKLTTSDRYSLKVLRDGQLQPSIYTDSLNQIILEYPEFTAIYPNGSVKEYQNDRDGNTIPKIRESGAMSFIARATHDVDHIRSEGYYGYIPKMDYTTEGNGLHNPAVRTSLKKSIYANLYKDLNIPATNDTLWIVSRGGVSHGCTRMAAGHILEARQIFPSNEKLMTKVSYFGNASSDYDLFDIDGDGKIEVMGVQYFLAYGIDSDSGEGYREGSGLIEESQNREKFYMFLYGKKNQFRIENNIYKFVNPFISEFSYDKQTDIRAAAFSIKMNGEFSLYEQAYEQDKMQFFKMSSKEMGTLQSASSDFNSLGKRTVRLFGRANGCGPFKNEFKLCNEDNFNKELNKLSTQISKVK
ncbi:MAG: hypothetical protein WA160_04645 [Pseudobdellovibrio sp.]